MLIDKEGKSYVEVAPYWNVNVLKQSKYRFSNTVEVAPYWNVNIADIPPPTIAWFRRSSSILECKYCYGITIVSR